MTVEVGISISVCLLVLAILTFTMNKKKENKAEGVGDGEIKKELEYIAKAVDGISRNVEDIRVDIRANERQMATMGERITRVEESTKQAHKRIDEIKGGDE